MCGIVGYMGNKNAVDIILEGLHRLEYRGYDSSGICLKNDTQPDLIIHKALGKLINLEEAVKNANFFSSTGVGHTRWATHGKVCFENTHPHGNHEIAIVHNGIIENGRELRDMLTKEGFIFSSETDSEVFFALVNRAMKTMGSLPESVAFAFSKVKGNSAFVVLSAKSKEIVGVKRGSPLVCGLKESSREVFISSDAYALAGYVDKLVFPEDEVVCLLSDHFPEGIKTLEMNGEPSYRFSVKVQDRYSIKLDKGNYEHYMLKEICEQPFLLRKLVQYYLDGEGVTPLKEAADLLSRCPHVHISASGSSFHAGLLIRNFLEGHNKIPTWVELASEFRYRTPILSPDHVGLLISPSGETSDTLAAQALFKKQLMKTLGISNSQGSTLFRLCTKNLLIGAGLENSMASPKSLTLEVATGYLLSRAISGELESPLVRKELCALADRLDEVLAQSDQIQKIAGNLLHHQDFLMTGRGPYHPIALEAALKFKEILYVHAEGLAAGELKHGPLSLVDENMVNVAFIGPEEETFPGTLYNLQEVKKRGGVTLGIGSTQTLFNLCQYSLPLNFVGLSDLKPLCLNVAFQLLTYSMAKIKGNDMDHPRKMKKLII